jgi:hypothetical protein
VAVATPVPSTQTSDVDGTSKFPCGVLELTL